MLYFLIFILVFFTLGLVFCILNLVWIFSKAATLEADLKGLKNKFINKIEDYKNGGNVVDQNCVDNVLNAIDAFINLKSYASVACFNFILKCEGNYLNIEKKEIQASDAYSFLTIVEETYYALAVLWVCYCFYYDYFIFKIPFYLFESFKPLPSTNKKAAELIAKMDLNYINNAIAISKTMNAVTEYGKILDNHIEKQGWNR